MATSMREPDDSPRSACRFIAHFAQRAKIATATTAQLSQLTERERDVFTEIAAGLSQYRDGRLFLGEQTVKTHIKHIFTKLDLRDRAQAVVFAYEHRARTGGLVGTGGPGPGAACG